MSKYLPREIEPKWQKRWADSRLYVADESGSKPSCYVLDMFPYPSGASMHVGHPRGYVATDAYSRFKRMSGHNVLHPMGWDAFGLPAEETAIANKEYPTLTVERNIVRFKEQLNLLGIGYDWTREINTTDPSFYKHTQRLFLEFFKRGLAYNATANVNWCAELGTVLANEDIVDGRSERGGYPVEQTPLRQWMLRITAYADRLIADLDDLPNWPEKIKNAQINWIGRSSGHAFTFHTNVNIDIPIFTTKLETIGGATFVVVAPDSDIAVRLAHFVTNASDVKRYIDNSRIKTARDRVTQTEITGILLEGIEAINPVSGELIHVIASEYVLSTYGTGAIMGVPFHDDRDKGIAALLDLPVRQVIDGEVVINSGVFSGLLVADAREKLSVALNAKIQINYKIRDWVFSRQRFWGEPFPIVWVSGIDNYNRIALGKVGQWLPKRPVVYEEDGVQHFAVPVMPEYLAMMRLPVVESYQPTGTTSGPLAGIDEWVNVEIDPKSGALFHPGAVPACIPARRETNTMPQWAGSSWYWLRYMDPLNINEPFSAASAKKWGPVDVYAGADHAVAHLIYARFWHKVLFDAGLVDFKEPFKRLEFLGYILASDGSKISKRKGNSRSPDDVIIEVGADAFRLYEMAIGPFEKAVPWSDENLVGYYRFLERIWKFSLRIIEEQSSSTDRDALVDLHKTIKKVSSDLEEFKFNTAISSLISFEKEHRNDILNVDALAIFMKLIAPFAPHIADEIWERLERMGSIHVAAWPSFDESLLLRKSLLLPVQIDGKVRVQLEIDQSLDEDAVKGLVLADPKVLSWTKDSKSLMLKYVVGRIVSITTK